MNFEIRDPDLEARLQKQTEASGSGSIEETLRRLIETQEEQDRWLADSKTLANEKIRQGLAQLDRGEGIPENELDRHLAKLKANQK